MRKYEQEECKRRPEPANLDKVEIEHITLFRKVARRFARGVRLCVWEVGGVAGRGVEGAEDGAEEECAGVDCEEDCFERCWEEGRAGYGW